MAKRFIEELIKVIKPYVIERKISPERATALIYVTLASATDEGLESSLRNVFGEKNEAGKTNLGTTAIQLSKLNEIVGDLNATVSEVNSDRLEKIYDMANDWLNIKRNYDNQEDVVSDNNDEDLRKKLDEIKDAMQESSLPASTLKP